MIRGKYISFIEFSEIEKISKKVFDSTLRAVLGFRRECMKMMSLRTMYETLGFSRRVIQGYEKAGLIKPAGKNKYGHLLYDDEAFERVKKIRFLQQLGFKLREIKELIDAPGEVMKEALKRRLEELESEKERLAQLIQEAYEYIESLK